MNLTVTEFAIACKVSRQSIYNRIKEEDIVCEIEMRHGNPTYVIDTNTYPVELFTVRQRGAKPKLK